MQLGEKNFIGGGGGMFLRSRGGIIRGEHFIFPNGGGGVLRWVSTGMRRGRGGSIGAIHAMVLAPMQANEVHMSK